MRGKAIIRSIHTATKHVEQYEKFEADIGLAATFDNPFDYEEIHVYCELTSPSGKVTQVDGFYMQGFSMDIHGQLTKTNKGFKIRFAPTELGKWEYRVYAKDRTGISATGLLDFLCIAKTSEINQGFIRKNATNYLTYDTGNPYIPIGENMSWQNSNPYTDYSRWIDQLAQNGGNFIRLWHAHWGLGLEWAKRHGGFLGLGKYHQANAYYQDWLFEYCAQKGISIMLTLQHHGQVSTQVNPNWEESPYNVENGGPCFAPWDFFSDATAIAMTKNRYRYIIARWGYARNLMAWELWNEVDWADQFGEHEIEVKKWHTDLAEFIKSIDPYAHLLTTSFAKEAGRGLIWEIPFLDFIQAHTYMSTGKVHSVLAGAVRDQLNQFQKPVLIGEFGIRSANPLGKMDPSGIHVHNGMWSALFSGALGAAMPWWWDTYIEEKKLYPHVKAISSILPHIPFVEAEMQTTPVSVQDAPGNFSIFPTLDWGETGDGRILVEFDKPQGRDAPKLSQYLYGAIWNTAHRNPPYFELILPKPSQFSVTTASFSSGCGPKIAIFLDGKKVLEENAKPDTCFKVLIPAGAHTIKVENTGIDWIQVSSYSFSGVGTVVDGYVLTSKDKNKAAGWVLNIAFNHQYVKENGFPDAIQGAKMIFGDFEPGDYQIKWFNCLSGKIIAVDELQVKHRSFSLEIPALAWDLAFVINDQKSSLGMKDVLLSSTSKQFPLPPKSAQTSP